MKLKKLNRSFYNQDTISVAKALLGKYIVHVVDDKELIGKIVETEAYLGPHDLAAHSAKGLTNRTAVMFGPPGHAYVYMIYGMYFCMNVVTEEEGRASAVLIRAVEPIKNIEERTQGPGLTCKAMHINKMLNGHDMTSSNIFYIATSPEKISHEIISKPRIGVDYAGEWAKELLRFYIVGNKFVSKK